MNKPKKIVVLMSGGLDSYIMYRYALHNTKSIDTFRFVYFDYGHTAAQQERWALPHEVEMRSIEWFGLDANIQDVGDGRGKIYIPGRNMVFAACAGAMFTPDEIWLGATANEVTAQATDKNETFCNIMSGLLSYTLSPFKVAPRVRMPLVEMGLSKKNLLCYAINELGITKEEVRRTHSCYHLEPSEEACGQCGQCYRRTVMNLQVGWTDREDLLMNPFSEEFIRRFKIDCSLENEVVNRLQVLKHLANRYGDTSAWR